jgi:hypothetical protein
LDFAIFACERSEQAVAGIGKMLHPDGFFFKIALMPEIESNSMGFSRVESLSLCLRLLERQWWEADDATRSRLRIDKIVSAQQER